MQIHKLIRMGLAAMLLISAIYIVAASIHNEITCEYSEEEIKDYRNKIPEILNETGKISENELQARLGTDINYLSTCYGDIYYESNLENVGAFMEEGTKHYVYRGGGQQ